MRQVPEAEPTEPAVTIARTIGRRVRGGRAEHGWTLDQLAGRSGVSRRMLVNIEQGTTNPSIATLLRVADALGIGLPVLVDTAGEDDDITVHRIGEVATMWETPAGGSAVLVAGVALPDVVELWDWHLGPGDTHRSDAHRSGTRELMFVLAGAVVLVVGEVEHRLDVGDSAAFPGSVPHAYRNASPSEPARFSLAVFEPAVTTSAGPPGTRSR